MIVTTSRIGFVRENYLNMRAASFNAAGMHGAALKEITKIEALREGTIGRHLTRSNIWLDIVASSTLLGIGQFDEAVVRAKKAFIVSRDINSVNNIANIVDIHGRLLRSPYKNESDVTELGDMLTETLAELAKESEQHTTEEDY